MGRNNKHKRGARNKRGPVRSERRPSLTGACSSMSTAPTL